MDWGIRHLAAQETIRPGLVAEIATEIGEDGQRGWNAGARAKLKRALGEKSEVATRLLTSLDDYARRWQDARRRACEATHVAGT